jgi:hypothetical protein
MTVVQFLIRSLVGRTLLASVNLDRKLQAFRHREGMGKNWRSYRRGCGRRFIFARSSMPVVLVSARIDGSTRLWSSASTSTVTILWVSPDSRFLPACGFAAVWE